MIYLEEIQGDNTVFYIRFGKKSKKTHRSFSCHVKNGTCTIKRIYSKKHIILTPEFDATFTNENKEKACLKITICGKVIIIIH